MMFSNMPYKSVLQDYICIFSILERNYKVNSFSWSPEDTNLLQQLRI